MKQHNALLRSTASEVKQIRIKQRQAQAEMDKLEKELLEKWNKEKESNKISVDTVEELLHDPDIVPVEAPVNANVWKVQVGEGDELKEDQTVVILEAMKLEINVNAEDHMAGMKVEKVLVKPNDVIEAGRPLMLLRKKKA